MSVKCYFILSSGLAKTLSVAKGTLAGIMKYVEHVEKALGLEREKYLDNPVHWESFKRRETFKKIDDRILCREVGKHNDWVRWIYDLFSEWSENPVKGGEKITPKDAETFWHALEMLDVSPERWTGEYYRERMEEMYAAMRGHEHGSNGYSFDAKHLTAEQAGAVIVLFSEYLDIHDIRLEVPVGRDELASSYDGGYEWSSTCGAIHTDDRGEHAAKCKKKTCEVRLEAEDDDQ